MLLCPPGWSSHGQEDSPKEQAASLVKRAKKALKDSKSADAYLFYSEASALEPNNRKLKAKMESLQSRAALDGKPSAPAPGSGTPAKDLAAKVDPGPALAALAGAKDDQTRPIPQLHPEDVFDSATVRDFAKSRQLQGLPQLEAKPGMQDFDLRGTPRALFDQVAQRFGLETVFDGDYPQAGQTMRFVVTGADYRQTLNDLQAMTNSFVVPLSPKLFLVASDTPQKRNDLEQTIAISIPVPQALTTQELTEIGQAVKQATNIDKLAWDTTEGLILIRDRISRALPAQALLNQLMAARAEVMVEVEFIDVSDSDLAQYGFNVTNSIPAVFLGSVMNSVPSIPAGVTNLLSFGGGRTLFGLGVAQAQAIFNQTLATTKTLYRSLMRSVDGQPVSLHVGEKFPVITQGYFGSVSASQQGQVFQPPPAFTFENLGVTLKVTPHVHAAEEVTLLVESSFELLTGGSVNGIPIFGQRQMNNSVRLTNGEWAVVAGITTKSRSRTTSGFWGLQNIPLIGNLFKQHSKDDENSNILIAIRPHLLSLPPDQQPAHSLRVGSDNRPFTPL